MKILVINAGSSSLKFQLIDMDDESVKAKGLVERIGIEGTHFKQTVLGTDKVIEFTRNMKDHTEAISAVLSALTDKDNGAITSLDEIGACGHRVLHGGWRADWCAIMLLRSETGGACRGRMPLECHQAVLVALCLASFFWRSSALRAIRLNVPDRPIAFFTSRIVSPAIAR